MTLADLVRELMNSTRPVELATKHMHAMTPAILHALETQIHNTNSPFLKLPPELRNRIYYLAALDALPAHVRNHLLPALLTTCRQTRAEFSSLYFSDAIMTLERKVHVSSEYTSHRVSDVTTLKALLGLPVSKTNKVFGSRFGKGGNVWFDHEAGGNSGSSAFHYWASVLDFTPYGTLTFAAGSGEAARWVYQSDAWRGRSLGKGGIARSEPAMEGQRNGG
ncbi:hypothetical protein LTR65_005880 [Meristemomyces frigidus]